MTAKDVHISVDSLVDFQTACAAVTSVDVYL